MDGRNRRPANEDELLLAILCALTGKTLVDEIRAAVSRERPADVVAEPPRDEGPLQSGPELLATIGTAEQHRITTALERLGWKRGPRGNDASS